MYSIVEIKGHQYRVSAGDVIDVELMGEEAGAVLNLENVLFVGQGSDVKIGSPVVKGAKVVAKLLKNDRAKKIIVLKRKPGAYKKKNGHRQHFTSLLITEIHDGSGKSIVIDSQSHNAKKHLNK